MKRLDVLIEMNGAQQYTGSIEVNDFGEGRFTYDSAYLQREGAAAVSCNLPLREESFSETETRIFFEGLLPEGFTRRSVAGWIHTDADDYLGILAGLGSECLGAVKICEEGMEDSAEPHYEPMAMEQIRALAREGASKSAELVTKAHLSLAGASGKVGLYFDEKDGSWFLPHGDAPSTHIVKQSHVRLGGIVTNEQLTMKTAGLCGLTVPDSFIINVGESRDEDILLATERFDRLFTGNGMVLQGLEVPKRLHQEDFAQALGIPPVLKYETENRNYLGRMFSLLRKVSSDPIRDQMALWDILMFDFLTGNTDNHLKNVSILYDPGLKGIRLAPAYDIVSTCVYDASTRDLAIRLGSGKSLDDTGRSALIEAADKAGIGKTVAMRRLDAIAGKFENALKESSRMLAEQGFPGTEDFAEKILSRGGYCRLA